MPRPRRTAQLSESTVPICEEEIVHLQAVRSARHALPPAAAIDRLSALFAMLGDPTRLRIVGALAAEELCVCDLSAVVGLSESAVSHHLRLLRVLKIVRHRRVGRLAIYSLDDEHVNGLYRQALEHIRHQDSGQS